MRLLLAQHGHALGKDEDPLRPLSDQGRRDIEKIAGQLKSGGVRVARVWHSGKLRAEQTAMLLAKQVLPGGGPEQAGGIAPNDPVDEFIADADVWQDDTLVVGHLPFMARLVSRLLAGDAERGIVDFSPGTLVCLERTTPDHWRLLWMLRPVLGRSESQP
jgi:phosphohistidine phosphatase